MTYQEQKNMFGQAVMQGIVQKFQQELLTSDEDGTCSALHLDAMRRITLGKKKPKKKMPPRKKWMIVIAAALALLLAGCAVYVNREEIKGFFVQVYKEFSDVSFDTSTDTQESNGEVVYQFEYIPEGYVFKDEIKNPLVTQYRWVDENNREIIFLQQDKHSAVFLFDAEHSDHEIIDYGGYSIYCKESENLCAYLWTDGVYALKLDFFMPNARDEMKKMIDHMVAK